MLMERQDTIAPGRSRMRTPTLRDFLAVIFRHRGLIIASFLAIFLGIILGTWMLPKQYEAGMKILVKRERVDPVVSPESNAQLIMQDVSLEDINSEVELLKSRDLLENVVRSCGLDRIAEESFMDRLLRSRAFDDTKPAADDMSIPRAVRALESAIEVEPIAKSKMIEVRYEAPDPKLAAQVLQTLAALYLDKHLAVHRPPGALDFFEQQTEQYHQGLAAAEGQLADFGRNKGVVSIEIEKDIALRKLSDFESQLREARTAEAAVVQRIGSLEAQAAVTPARITTQVKTSDDPLLLQQLKTTLLGLELRRTELLAKFEPGYRSVQEVDAQIAQARETLARAEKSELRDVTSDLDKTRQWLDEELARSRAEQATLRARTAEIARSVASYQERAQRISRMETAHKDLNRAAKTAEDNYLLYLRKQEEARISDALDRKRIVNVAIAEAATVPAIPSGPRWLLSLALGLALAFLSSLGLAFVADYLDPSFRTPDEVESYLGIPVIASLPRK
jgi:uncharacterized protein involved in exopolysaccharide biosynthesis